MVRSGVTPVAGTSLTIAVIDGPYDMSAMAPILAQPPTGLAQGSCALSAKTACNHGTFIMGLLGARDDAPFPGLCPNCKLLHVPLFVDDHAPWASVEELAAAIKIAVNAGARLINLSLAILGDNEVEHPDLARALDAAEESGAVILSAAGNQRRPAIGQLLSHPATVPVVAVDAACALLPDCNFGPTIAQRGVATLGHEVWGYAPGGRRTVMSGTSVATAVATGILGKLWSTSPEIDGAEIRAAIARLTPRDGAIPPILDADALSAVLGRTKIVTVKHPNYVSLQGEMSMLHGSGQPQPPTSDILSTGRPGHLVAPAHGATGCACGAPNGLCTCTNGDSSQWRFVYVLGSVDIRFPNQSISEELQDVARMLAHKTNGDRSLIEPGPREHLRKWYSRVLLNPGARYIARQVCWVLSVERQPAYYLALRDLHDLDDLIRSLAHPEDDLDLVVGSSSMIPVTTCPGIAAPVLAVDQLSSFDQDRLAKWVKPSSKTLKPPSKAKSLGKTSEELFAKLVQSADNFGDTDEWRALNYLAVNYQPLYEQYAVMSRDGWTLDSIKVMPSRLGRERRIVDPVFTFRQLDTGLVQKYFVRVDVSHLFPMMVNTIAEYFDR